MQAILLMFALLGATDQFSEFEVDPLVGKTGVVISEIQATSEDGAAVSVFRGSRLVVTRVAGTAIEGTCEGQKFSINRDNTVSPRQASRDRRKTEPSSSLVVAA